MDNPRSGRLMSSDRERIDVEKEVRGLATYNWW